MKPKDKHEFLRLYDVHKTYRVISEVGAGTYGRVYKAVSTKSNKFVALKKIDMTRQELDGFPITAIREIKLLRMLNHKNIIALLEIIMSRPSTSNKFRGSTYLVFEYMDHDFVGLMTIKYRFKLNEIKCIMKQMLEGLKYLHDKKIIHRDMKSANILLNNNGEVKIADFGLARQASTGPNIYYTNKVVTLWYRAPELLLGSTDYTTQIDIWSLGCIFAELLTGEILFKGDKEARQLEIIYEICGSPDKNNWSDVEKLEYFSSMGPKTHYERRVREIIKGKREDLDNETVDFLDDLLILDPKKRLTAETALAHQFFKIEPLECNVRDMPRIEKECHETLLRAKKVRKEEMSKNNEVINEKIGLGNDNLRSPLIEQNSSKFTSYKDFKEKPVEGYNKGFDDGGGHVKPYYNTNRGGYKGPGSNMRGNTFYKGRGFHNEPFISKGFSNHPNSTIPGGNVGGFRGGYRGGVLGYRKFSDMNNNDNVGSGGGNNTDNNNNSSIPLDPANKNNVLLNLNIQDPDSNNEKPKENSPIIEDPILNDKRHKNNELREMLIAHRPSGGLRSLIQNQITQSVGGLKDEERESFKLEEVFAEPTGVSQKMEELVIEKAEVPALLVHPTMQVPSFDKTILNEKRIKKKDPNLAANNNNPGEAIIKKVHME